ncbi:hypothetical protein [Pantoea sp. 1.19]|uniref:hypothetical protein n=1 Tax=Pantoea sp. 1.19 TaxID=1925589 RepID=UPI000948AEC7|nr:hypothetical protein [Pantoea sp. 1.19]
MQQFDTSHRFLFEPVQAPDQTVIAWALQARAPSPPVVDARGSVAHGWRQRRALFIEQVMLLVTLQRRSDRLPPIVLSVDAGIAEEIALNRMLREQLCAIPTLRLAISGPLSAPAAGERTPLRTVLAQICPLWLEGLGRGCSNLTLVMNHAFEYVSIDKTFFWRYGEGRAFRDLVAHLRPSCRGVLVDGVRHAADEERLRALEVSGMRGTRWPAIAADDLIDALTAAGDLY